MSESYQSLRSFEVCSLLDHDFSSSPLEIQGLPHLLLMHVSSDYFQPLAEPQLEVSSHQVAL